MVKILANGDVVQDDDPRLKKHTQSSGRGPRMGSVRHTEDPNDYNQGEGQGQAGAGAQYSVFDVLNQKLLDAGLPSFNLGEHEIQPIVYVGFILAFILMGVHGLIFGLILFVICKLSASNGGFGQLLNSFFGGAVGPTRGQRDGGSNRLGGRVIRRR